MAEQQDPGTDQPKIKKGEEIKDLHSQEHKYPEVLFPGRFTNQQPWQADPDFIENPQPVTIPIYRLSHITHNREALGIHPKPFTFIPKPKLGKAYVWDGTPRGETYKETGDDTYQEIPRSEANPVFPGYLSWWGIDVKEWYQTSPELLQNIIDHRDEGRYAPGYLAEATSSQYGDTAFSIDFRAILRDYQLARDPERKAGVTLKVGGTLRYRNEICYVVIVCVETDNLSEMPSINGNTLPFVPKGLVNDGGTVVMDYNDPDTPEFRVNSIIKSEKAGPDPSGRQRYLYNYFSWEQLVFAFYFTSPDQRLVCNNVDRSSVDHHSPICPKCRNRNTA